MYRIFILIFVMHVVAGFFMQSKRISVLKQDHTKYLFVHVLIYTLFFAVFSPILLGISILQGLVYSGINGLLHLIVDYFTNKFTAKYHDIESLRHKLIKGLDYTLHVSCLILSFYLLFSVYKLQF